MERKNKMSLGAVIEIVQLIIPYIEYSVEDCQEGKIYRGILRVVEKRL